MESICAIKDIYKALYQFEKTFAEVHDITINEAMLLCCLKDGETKSAGMICEYIGLSNSRVSKVITAAEKKVLFPPQHQQKRQTADVLLPHSWRKRKNTADDECRTVFRRIV